MSSLSGTVLEEVMHQKCLRKPLPSGCLEPCVHIRWDEARLIRHEDSLPYHPQTAIPLATVQNPRGIF